MSTSQRWGRRGAYAVGGLLVLLALLGGLVYAWANSAAGRAWIAREAGRALSTPGETVISIEGLTGRLPGDIRIESLSVADAAGPWLTAGGLRLAWDPWSLLGDTLEIEVLAAERIAVERQPQAAAGAEEHAAGLPSLPLQVRLLSLEVRDLALAEAVLGEAARLTIAGSARTQADDTLQASLTIKRSDGVASKAEVEARYRPADGHLALELDLSEPPGGLLARLIGRPDLPALAVGLSGEGPLADWRGRFTGSLDGLGKAEAELTIQQSERLGFTLAGQVERSASPGDSPSLGGPSSPRDPLWDLLPARTDFDLAGAWDEDEILTLDRAKLRSEGLSLELSGRLDFADGTVDAEAKASAGDLAPFRALLEGIEGTGLVLEVAAKGPLAGPDLRLHATAERLSAPDVEATALDATAHFQPEKPFDAGPPVGRLTSEGTLGSLAVAGTEELRPLFGPSLTWRSAGRLDLAAGLLQAEHLSVEGGTARVSAAGALALSGEQADLQAEASLDDLSRLQSLTGLAMTGAATLAGPVTLRDGGREVTANLTGQARGFTADLPFTQPTFAGDLTLATDLRLDAEGLALTALSVTSSDAELRGDASFDAGFETVEATYDLSLPDAAVLAAELGVAVGGTARVQGRARGRIDNPDLDGKVELARLGLEGVALTALSGDFEIKDPAGRPAGTVSLAARTPYGAATARSALVLEDERLRLSGARLDLDGASAQGDALVPLDGGPVTGAFDLRAARLGPWLALAGLQGSGSAEGQATLRADGGRQGVDLKVTLGESKLLLDGGTGLGVAAATASLRIPDARTALDGDFDLQARDLDYGELQLATLALSGTGGLEAADITLRLDGRWQAPLALTANARIARDATRLQVDLNSLEGAVAEQSLALQGPAHLTFAEKTVEVRGLALTYGDARARLDGRIATEALSARLVVEELRSDLLGPLWPADLKGVLAAEVELAGSVADPSGRLSFSASDLRTSTLSDVPPLELKLDGTWRNRRLALDGRLSGATAEDAELTADLPLALDPDSLLPEVSETAPFSASVSWSGEVAPLWNLTPFDLHRLTGNADVQGQVAGSLSAPQITGHLTLAGGRYENLEVGTLLKKIEISVDLTDEQATLSQLTATDGKSGKLTGSGSAELDPAAGFPFRLDAELKDLILLRSDEVTGGASGTLSVEGSTEESKLSGRLETGTIEIRIPERLPSEVAKLQVIEVGADGEPLAEQTNAPARAGGYPVALDLRVDMPRRVFVRGRGIDSEWKGRLRAKGTVAKPRIEGQLTLVRGQVSVAGKPFKFDRGTIDFQGTEKIDPTIDLVAVRTSRDLTTQFRLFGRASDPQFEMSSVPDLPEDEIMSRVLFGKSTSQLTAFEAAQVAAAVASLTTGGGGGANLLDRMRSGVGLDVLRFGTTDVSGKETPAASAGVYVSDQVYLGVTQGTQADSGSVNVEVELAPHISVESDVTGSGDSNIGLKFKFDY